jgi:acyl-CoA dehydrogenase
LWSALDDIGIVLLSVPEESGGAGGDLCTATSVLQVLGAHAATVPLAETALLAGWILSECGAPIPSGVLTATMGGPEVSLMSDGDGWTLSARIGRVPWARAAEHIVIVIDRQVVVVPHSSITLRPGANLAGEPRDQIVLDAVPVSGAHVHTLPEGTSVDGEMFRARGAVGRLAMMAGAARRAFELSLSYASQREQFGRPIVKFQSVQQQLAAMAAEVLLCKIAAESAAQAVNRDALVGDGAWRVAVAAAVVSASNAAGTVAKLAHQVHGAIGFTEEHDLRLSTTRIWSWRDEYGTVAEWSALLGRLVAESGPDGLWPALTR